MSVEDQLRAVGRAVSDQVRDLPELDLMAMRRTRAGLRARLPRRRPAGWLIPLAAAAAVIVMAATLVAVRTLSASPVEATALPAASGAAALVPPYYAEVTRAAPGSAAPQNVTIGATATGQTLLSVKPPRGTSFADVSAAADDRAFAVSLCRLPCGDAPEATTFAWDLLRVGPGPAGYTLHRLSVPAPDRGTRLSGFALSPDGTRLAVLTQRDPARAADPSRLTLRLYSVATGRPLRTWQTAPELSYLAITFTAVPFGSAGPDSITWLADGHEVAFQAIQQEKTPADGNPQTAKEIIGVWRLDLSGPGTDLIAGSTQVVAITGWGNKPCTALYPAADGKSALCGTQSTLVAPNGTPNCQRLLPPAAFRAYAGPAGYYRQLYTFPRSRAPKGVCVAGIARVLWASPSGSVLVGSLATLYGPDPHAAVVGVLSGGKWTPLPVRAPASGGTRFAF